MRPRRRCTVLLLLLLVLVQAAAPSPATAAAVVDSTCAAALPGCAACTDAPPAAPQLPQGYRFAPGAPQPRPAVMGTPTGATVPLLPTAAPMTMRTTPSAAAAAAAAAAGAAAADAATAMPLQEQVLRTRQQLVRRARSLLSVALFGWGKPKQQEAAMAPQAAVVAAAAVPAPALPPPAPQMAQDQRQRTTAATIATATATAPAPAPAMRPPAPAPVAYYVAAAAPAAGDGPPLLGGASPVPLLELPPAPPQALTVLTSDPRNATGPHPWDVLLFKTSQFNTTRPAYRLGGLGLMLMSDFNKSRPLTDWHVLHAPGAASGAAVRVGKDAAAAVGGELGVSGLSTPLPLPPPAAQAAAAPDAAAAAAASSAGSSRPGSLVALLQQTLSALRVGRKADDAGGAAAPVAGAAAAAAAAAAAGGDDAAAAAPVGPPRRLYCTACLAPAYRTTPFGYCVCAAGYGRVLDSKAPYACQRCPEGHIAAAPVMATLGGGGGGGGGGANANQRAPAAAAALSVCSPCPEGTRADDRRTSCVPMT